ncbi:hypothetical protein RRG08_001980 [Elysia crispata]|uniref:Uncharacterized protein n=1 Tax=Elysia crispata TaxID=231223 RepID=A0AAE1BAJ4_9GAST|nr:hypothetical protein RRG08_001980 [Elysia crispata]
MHVLRCQLPGLHAFISILQGKRKDLAIVIQVLRHFCLTLSIWKTEAYFRYKFHALLCRRPNHIEAVQYRMLILFIYRLCLCSASAVMLTAREAQVEAAMPKYNSFTFPPVIVMFVSLAACPRRPKFQYRKELRHSCCGQTRTARDQENQVDGFGIVYAELMI